MHVEQLLPALRLLADPPQEDGSLLAKERTKAESAIPQTVEFHRRFCNRDFAGKAGLCHLITTCCVHEAHIIAARGLLAP